MIGSNKAIKVKKLKDVSILNNREDGTKVVLL
jgi:hypothetical protein